ncbi:MAG: adenylate/guanylate cyclase domain-containing protein [Cyanobacteria bacterium P01_F01_bin.150]
MGHPSSKGNDTSPDAKAMEPGASIVASTSSDNGSQISPPQMSSSQNLVPPQKTTGRRSYTDKLYASSQVTTTQLSPIEIDQVGPFSRLLGNVSIRWVLTLPFIIQIIGVVSIVGFLSFLNGRQSVENLLSHLQSEIGDRVGQRLHDYLKTPYQVTRINQQAYELGFLDVDDLDRMQKYFHQQMQLSDSLSYVNFGHANGSFIGVGRDEENKLYGEHITPEQPGEIQKYYLDDQGNRVGEPELIDYEPREDTWYTDAVEAQQPLWTDIYQWPDDPDISSISASYPVYADSDAREELVGVLGADFILSQINQFLIDLVSSTDINEKNAATLPSLPQSQASETLNALGHVFIVERETGLLVANSSQTPAVLRSENGDAIRIPATQSSEALIQATATYLQKNNYYDSFSALAEGADSVSLKRVPLLGDRQYIRLMSWNRLELDWVIVVVVPESVFMDQINSNTYNTFLLCILALAIAIWVGIRTAHWITQPILFLNRAAKNLADGAWNQTFVLERSDEVGELAQSFNDMARQLRHSFRDLESQKNSFARFFPSEYLTFLNKPAVTDVRLGDHVSREMTVMFTDIRGFTSMSEVMTPGETFDFVNAYLEEVAPAVRFHNGVIVKFLGDGTMAVFPESANSALNAGIDTFHCLQTYNQRRVARQEPPIDLGIGIHVGHMMVGIVGERNRMQADALSDTVNLTARLEGLTKFYGVSLLVSDSVVQNLLDPDEYQLRFLGEAIVKGRSEPIGIYEVIDVEADAVQIVKRKTLESFHKGVDAYRNGELDKAKGYFETVLAAHPDDYPAQRFIQYIQNYLDNGMPKDWDGVWRLTQK